MGKEGYSNTKLKKKKKIELLLSTEAANVPSCLAGCGSQDNDLGFLDPRTQREHVR